LLFPKTFTRQRPRRHAAAGCVFPRGGGVVRYWPSHGKSGKIHVTKGEVKGVKKEKPMYEVKNSGVQAAKAIRTAPAKPGKTVVRKGKDLRCGQ
jgi:hypothetical protein